MPEAGVLLGAKPFRQERKPCHAAPAVQREQRRLQGQRRRDRRQRNQEAAHADRAHERERDEQEQREPDRDGGAGEDDRAPGGLHRPDDRRLDLATAAQFFSKAIDHEQRVVDRDPQPDQEDEVGHVRRGGQEVRVDVNAGERRHHRARREDERHRHRDGEAEDRKQDEHRDRQGDHLALPQVLGEDRVEVVLDRGLPGYVGLDTAAVRKRPVEVVGVALGLGDAQRRDDVPVDDVAPGRNELPRCRVRHDPSRAVDIALQAHVSGAIDTLAEPENDRERAVAAIAEVALENRPRPLRVGSRNRELVREQRAQVREREAAGEKHDEPARENRPAKPQHHSRPALHQALSDKASDRRLAGST